MDLTNNWHALLGSSNCSYMYLTYITSHFPNIWHILFAFFVLPGTYVGVGYYVIIDSHKKDEREQGHNYTIYRMQKHK